MAAQNSFFRRFVNHREPRPVSDDPADMGTAFGLEASLSEFDAGEQAANEHDRAGARERAPMDWLAERNKARR